MCRVSLSLTRPIGVAKSVNREMKDAATVRVENFLPLPTAHRYTQVPAGVWEPVQLVEVRLCLTSIVDTFPIPAGITSFGCLHILVYNDEYRPVEATPRFGNATTLRFSNVTVRAENFLPLPFNAPDSGIYFCLGLNNKNNLPL